MKTISCVKIMVQVVVLSALASAYAVELKLGTAPAEVYFRPGDACTGVIVKEINKAKAKVLVQAYSFTSEDITAALIRAHQRGVHVELILDKSNRTAKHGAGHSAAQAGIRTLIDAAHAIANNKIMIIDGARVLTGSFNFTKAAEEKNAENLLIIQDTNLAAIYLKNWEKHKEHSERYEVK